MESDETLIYNAAHVMVSNLAASLAHVTCKVSYSTLNLRSLVFCFHSNVCFHSLVCKEWALLLLGTTTGFIG